MAEKFKVAILGAGNIAGSMAAAINGVEELEAYAVGSRSLEKSQEFAKKWNFTKAYGSYEEMVQDSEIDLVYVATPHAMHYANAKLCIENGKNVLVEKAFTANATQAKKLIELAKEKGVLLAEAMWTRYMPGLQMIRDIIDAGKIGEVDSVEADFSIPISDVKRLHDPALAGGALLDVGIYPLTFASIILGDDIASTRSRCLKYATGVDATDHIELTYKNGKQAFLRASMVSGDGESGRINGTKGCIEVSKISSLKEIRVYDVDGKLQETVIPPMLVNGYEYEVLACKRTIEAGQKECEEMPHSQIMIMMEQMDALRGTWGVVYPFDGE